MVGKKLVKFNCPEKLLAKVDEKIEAEGKYSNRTGLLLSLLRKYMNEER